MRPGNNALRRGCHEVGTCRAQLSPESAYAAKGRSASPPLVFALNESPGVRCKRDGRCHVITAHPQLWGRTWGRFIIERVTY